MRLASLVLLLFFGTTNFAQNIEGSFEYDGELREYTVFLPSVYTEGSSLPLVINLHGFGSNRNEQRLYSNMNPVADTAGYIVVYPQGLNRQAVFGGSGNSWDAGFGTDVDDVGFLSALIDRLWSDYGIDLSRVYATGMSNGGYMSYELACSLSDRIAAIASVTGSMTVTTYDNCAPERPVPVLQFHGTADLVVNYNGIAFFSRSLEDVIDFWVAQNDCPATADTIAIADTNTEDGSTVTHYVYEDCAANSAVEFYKIANGGHTWPGAFPIPAGNTNQDISATPLIIDFFGRFVHPDPRAGTVFTSTDEEPAQSGISLAPNPARHTVMVQLPTETTGQLWLYTAHGQAVRQLPVAGRTARLPVADLPAGLYVLHLRYPQGQYVEPLLVE